MLLLPDEDAYCGARLYEMGNVNLVDMTRAWQTFSATMLDFITFFSMWNTLILTSCLKKINMSYTVLFFLCITKTPPSYDRVRCIFPKSKESPSVGSCSGRNESYAAGVGMNRGVSRVIGFSPWFSCSDQTCKSYSDNWRKVLCRILRETDENRGETGEWEKEEAAWLRAENNHGFQY